MKNRELVKLLVQLDPEAEVLYTDNSDMREGVGLEVDEAKPVRLFKDRDDWPEYYLEQTKSLVVQRDEVSAILLG